MALTRVGGAAASSASKEPLPKARNGEYLSSPKWISKPKPAWLIFKMHRGIKLSSVHRFFRPSMYGNLFMLEAAATG